MPSQNIHVLTEVANLETLSNELAKLQKTLRYLLNRNLDFENVRVKGLTAETIDVDELSAITANMGKLTSGEIYGAYIATSETSYPRAEMSSAQDQFKAARTVNQFIDIKASDSVVGAPILRIADGSYMTTVYQVGSTFAISSTTSDMAIDAASNELRLLGADVSVKGGVTLQGFPGNFSSATTVVDLRTDFNNLISYLRAMNVLA